MAGMAMGRGESVHQQLVVAAAAVVVAGMMLACVADAQYLRNGYYAQTCPKAESIVFEEVEKAWNADRRMPAALIRLHFHDCFVNVSNTVLLETGDNQAEKNALPNLSLRGFDFIDKARARIEAACPVTVSCADIVAYAARDSVRVATGGFMYAVPGGRQDGTVSRASLTGDLPLANQRDVNLLKRSFEKKNLTLADMVVLSGAHTLGVTRCGMFDYRLMSDSDKGMDAAFRNDLRRQCNYNKNTVVSLDAGSEFPFDTSYYANVLANRTMLESDAALNSPATVDMVRQLRGNNNMFFANFATAMVKMGNVRGSYPGKVRLNCRRVRT